MPMLLAIYAYAVGNVDVKSVDTLNYLLFHLRLGPPTFRPPLRLKFFWDEFVQHVLFLVGFASDNFCAHLLLLVFNSSSQRCATRTGTQLNTRNCPPFTFISAICAEHSCLVFVVSIGTCHSPKGARAT